MGLFVKSLAKTPVNTKGMQAERVRPTVRHGQELHADISVHRNHPRGDQVRQGDFTHSGKFPPNGNQEKPKNRISFDVKQVGDAAKVPLGPQDSKTGLTENQKKKKSAAQTLYPKHRSVMQTEAS